MKYFTILLMSIFLAVGCNPMPKKAEKIIKVAEESQNLEGNMTKKQLVNFFEMSNIFSFTGQIPNNWQTEFVPATESINIYDTALPGANNLDKSLIFIRYFRANKFLTLSTVNILNRQAANINGHDAVKYEIEKKPGVANFPNQPLWRSLKHKLIDIRLDPTGQTYFYVFSYSPNLPGEEFDQFINSLKFRNDIQTSTKGLVEPLSNALARVTKKPFGIKVDQQNSPVSPERFNGFHNAVDFEIFPGEEDIDIAVFAICNGKLLQKKQATGYGGVVVQACVINGKEVTVIYGHLKLASINLNIDNMLASGEQLGILGKGFSKETDGERKHLHLGIYKGSVIDIRGYVQKQPDLNNWEDFIKVFQDL